MAGPRQPSREPPRSAHLRSLPGLAIPVLTLLALAIMAVGVASAPWGGLPAAALGAIAFVALAVPLAVVIVLRTPAGERGVIHAARALVFSAAYDFARALALVVRAGHRTRRAA